ncbi:MAG: M48 family metalloprotease, partial [Prochlorotrichaceae cyanobacterium]
WIAQAALARYRDRLLEADQFYRSGNLQQAAMIQASVKPEFTGKGVAITDPIMDINSPRLSGAAGVYWRNAQDGLAQNLESKIFKPLHLLTENYPDFIPGHIALARACEENPVGCDRNAEGSQPTNAIDVIDRASALFPDHRELLDTHIDILERSARETKKPYPLLEASILARQYAINNPDRPESLQYRQISERLEAEYQTQLQDLVYSQYVIQSLLGTGKDALMLMALGESGFGDWNRDQILASKPVLANPEIQAYVNRIGQQLARDTGRSDFDYEFFVMDDASPNAYATAGGKVFVNAGLLMLLQTEAELAGILSHEIAHTTLSHGYVEAIEDMVTEDSLRNLLGGRWGRIASTAVNAERSRKHERASDILGTRLLARSEYSADGIHSAMARFVALEGNRQASWADSHPISRERVLYLEDLILRNNYNRYAYEGVSDYIAMQQNIMGTIASAGGGSTTGSAAQNNLTNVSSTGSPSGSSASNNTVTAGVIPLNINHERSGVRIELIEADVTTRGTYSLKFTVANNTSEAFSFVIPFSQVVDQAGNRITAKFYCDDQTFLDPGARIACECQVFGQKWQATAQQDLIMVIKEATIGARVFRIAF